MNSILQWSNNHPTGRSKYRPLYLSRVRLFIIALHRHRAIININARLIYFLIALQGDWFCNRPSGRSNQELQILIMCIYPLLSYYNIRYQVFIASYGYREGNSQMNSILQWLNNHPAGRSKQCPLYLNSRVRLFIIALNRHRAIINAGLIYFLIALQGDRFCNRPTARSTTRNYNC